MLLLQLVNRKVSMVSSSSSSPLDPSSAQQQADCQGVQTSPDSTSHGTEQVSQGGSDKSRFY